MNPERFKRYILTNHVFVPPLLYHFLNRANFSALLLLRNVQVLANQLRGSERLAGIDLMNRNVKREAYRLRFYNRLLIDLAMNIIWQYLPSFQRNQFIRLANNVNNINQNRVLRIRPIDNTATLDRIARINNRQITNNYFEQSFFDGTNFNDDRSLESLILPAGFQ
ncbi:hypothetical protein RclHR1_11870008 [Rhizophagus clarus]|uniref:Uncharacterized protein n=1 Tax=Rhizophagus clarus TaxID=94130 RepID=A0A2Z6Q5I5_9GLOM|nr:hypothetical protein RclHR1_11870008 [Rhizophagus clarus]GES87743.1 hypothetical protein GLOIN_2v1762903 [Rhizophagus clarus]